jgi:hypothetical protein
LHSFKNVITVFTYAASTRRYSPTLRILQLSRIDISEEDRSSILYETEFDEVELQEDKAVNTNEIRIICKMILRNI